MVWKPLVIGSTAEDARRFRVALVAAGLPDPHALTTYPAAGEIAGCEARSGCNLCLVELSGSPEQALIAIGEAALVMPVIGLNPGPDTGLVLRAIRAGACDFLSDLSPDQIDGVLDRLSRSRTPAEQKHNGKLFCVLPGKPGVGASTLAVHLALDARTAGDAATLLIDGDPLTATVGFLLKLKSEYPTEEALRDWNRMDDDLWSRLVVRVPGVDVLLAPENPCVSCTWTPEIAAALAAFCRKRYDLIVVDMPDARSAVASGFASLADDLILVATNELAALHATRRALEHIEQTVPDKTRLRLILNRYTPAAGLKRVDVKTALQAEPFAVLNNDYDLLQTAILEGRAAPPSSRYGASVRTLSMRLRGRAPSKQTQGSWLRRLGLKRK
jgi:pilus assembly protein CpaE